MHIELASTGTFRRRKSQNAGTAAPLGLNLRKQTSEDSGLGACVAVTLKKTGRDGSFMRKKNGLYFRCGPTVVTGGLLGGLGIAPQSPPPGRACVAVTCKKIGRDGSFMKKKNGLYFRCGPMVVTGGYWGVRTALSILCTMAIL